MKLEVLNAEISKIKCPGQKQNAVPGEGPEDAAIMFVGECPGRNEMVQGRPFVGLAGRFLNIELEKFGIDRKKLYITNVCKCLPPKGRRPSEKEIALWLPYLKKQIRIIQPKLICLLGDVAVKSLLGKGFSVSRDHGKIIVKEGKRFMIMPHPSAARRFARMKSAFERDILVLQKIYKKLIK